MSGPLLQVRKPGLREGLAWVLPTPTHVDSHDTYVSFSHTYPQHTRTHRPREPQPSAAALAGTQQNGV